MDAFGASRFTTYARKYCAEQFSSLLISHCYVECDDSEALRERLFASEETDCMLEVSAEVGL